MDFNSLKDTVAGLTLYDVKAGVRKVQNAVMNYTDMEAKVREATNNEPWGASSTLMQEIANGTFNYQTLNEIMPMIYRRFTEKAAEEWRQIYKSLQLLEFLIKHGSERVIDDARSHMTLLKMLRQFHFIDQNGKDQGVNVRNRAKELAELLSDVDRIRAERKKARSNKAKYTGVEGGAGTFGGFSGGSSGRYGGFGSESAGAGGADYGGYSGGVYGDGGGFGGQSSDYQESGGRGGKFEEYDEGDDVGHRPSPAANASGRAGVKRTTGGTAAKKAEPVKKAPEVDLFSFDDEPASTSSPALAAPAKAPASGNGLASLSAANDDDDFDDFQSATPANQTTQSAFAAPLAPPITSNTSGAQFAAPQPVSAPKQADLAGMVGLSSISPTSSAAATPGAPNYSSLSSPMVASPAAQPLKPTGYQPSGPNYFTSVQVQAQQAKPASAGSSMASLGKPTSTSTAAKPAAGGDAFGALWSSASGGLKKGPAAAGPTMGQLAKEKSAAGIWGAPASSSSTPLQNKPPQPTSGGNAFGGGDLLG